MVLSRNWSTPPDDVLPYSASTSGAGPFSFEVILKPGGEIVLQYLTLNAPGSSHTVGIQDGTGAVGLNIAYNTAYLHDNMAIRIHGGLDWLSCGPTSGTIPPGGSVDLTVGMNAAGMALGAHTGLLTIVSDDPLNPAVDVPVTMMVSDMSPVGEAGLPQVMVLDQNVPNPFNPQTTIRFALPRDGKVDLKIYDVRGAVVRTLVSGHLTAGRHEAVWQGRDDAGRRAPSGVYFSRLVTDDGVQTRRLTMVK